ncbi:acyl-CoA dehydrogenase family protein [Bradyrhizobium sp.]|uniref:acyl-CoA dehydrogenase family protein n=1 Tax=Bradyrhizobium sp. TaxID=376 RepID=UPI003C7384FB
MNFQPTEEQQGIRDLARRFAVEKIAPRVKRIEEADEFFPDIVRAAGELGFLGMELPESAGGINSGTIGATMATQEFARVNAAVCNVLGAIRLHVGLIHRFGSEVQKNQWMEPLTAGTLIGGFAITEPGSGSDVASLATTAIRDGDDYIINGQKIFITLAPACDMMIVLTTTDRSLGSRGQTCFIVERNNPGLHIGPKEPMMGQHGIPVSAVYFENCRVPASSMLGALGQGFKIMMSGLDGTRLDIAALSLGLSQAAYEQAAAHAASRQQFGRKIGDFQGVGFMLAEMATEIDAGRFLLYHAGALRDAGKPFTKEASMAKYFCADNAMRHTTDAVQIFGGLGYTKAYPMERLMRDAKICQIYDGTSQIHRLIIARQIVQEFSKSMA